MKFFCEEYVNMIKYILISFVISIPMTKNLRKPIKTWRNKHNILRAINFVPSILLIGYFNTEKTTK